jgi:hypothetical protein
MNGTGPGRRDWAGYVDGLGASRVVTI